MGASQSIVGGGASNKNKAKQFINGEQDNVVFLDMSDERILKRLGIYEDCFGVNDYDCKNSIKNIVVDAHGELVSGKNQVITVPKNIVVLFMGEIGKLLLSDSMVTHSVCSKQKIPYQIALPNSKIPNINLQGEYKLNRKISTGIFDCEKIPSFKTIAPFRYPLKGFENWLLPIDENIKNNMILPVKNAMFSKKDEKTLKIQKEKHEIQLSEVLREISKKIGRNNYGFVYVTSCLGTTCQWGTTDEIEIYTNPLKDDGKSLFSFKKGYTVKTVPRWFVTTKHFLNDKIEYNPVDTNDKKLAYLRKKIVNNILNDTENMFELMELFVAMITSYPNEKLEDHILKSSDINKLSNNNSRLFYRMHISFINSIRTRNTVTIELSWNMQSRDDIILLPKIYYASFAKSLGLLDIKTFIEKLENKKEYFDTIDDYNDFLLLNELINVFEKEKNIEKGKDLLLTYLKYNKDINFYNKLIKRYNKDSELYKIIYVHLGFNQIINKYKISTIFQHKMLNEYKNVLNTQKYIDYIENNIDNENIKNTLIKEMQYFINNQSNVVGGSRGSVGSGGSVGSVGMWQSGGFFMTCS